jgi:ribosomal protein S13
LEAKISLNQIKNTAESHRCRLEQVEGKISGLKDKTDIKKKQNSTASKGTHKNLEIPSKGQTCKSWASKKEKRCKLKVYIIYSTK